MQYNPGLIVVAHVAMVEDPEAARELSLNAGTLPDGNPIHVVCMLPARVVKCIAWIHEEELAGFQKAKPDRITVLRTAEEVRLELARRREQARKQGV